jgi:hypothetical protein
MPEELGPTFNVWSALSDAGFDIEGQDQLAALRQQFPTEPTEEGDRKKLQARWDQFLKDLRIRVSTLLKTDSLSFLLGAGASKEAGGVLIGSLPLEVERSLLELGTSGSTVRGWLQLLYVALRHESIEGGSAVDVPVDPNEIISRRDSLASATALPVNFERLLSRLHRWRSALPIAGGRLRLDGPPALDAESERLDECLQQAKSVLAQRCVLPVPGAEPALRSFAEFLKKLLTRPLNLKRVNLFTLNYDTVVEQAADSEGVVLLDGFVGTIRRIFRPESYDQDLYFPAETTEGRVHRLDRVLHLYKLHGSINWRATEPDWDNPYGVSIRSGSNAIVESPLIYPTPLKYGETLGMPYAELFRRLAAAVVRPQSTLFVIGYGFGDDHVNAIIRQALAVPSFTLVVVDPFAASPDPNGAFLARLRAQKDRRIWVVSGEALGRFAMFAERVLPDLRDEEILRKVISTHRSLAASPAAPGDGEGLDGE